MKNILTLTDAAKALHDVGFYNWYRGDSPRQGELTLYHDDIAADRRTITRFTFRAHSITRTTTHLSGYDPEKNMWTKYPVPEERDDLPNRAGEKKLREALRADALAQTGYPNPQSFTRYKLDPERDAKEAMERHYQAAFGC